MGGFKCETREQTDLQRRADVEDLRPDGDAPASRAAIGAEYAVWQILQRKCCVAVGRFHPTGASGVVGLVDHFGPPFWFGRSHPGAFCGLIARTAPAVKPGCRDDARGWLQFAEVYGDGRVEAETCLDVLSIWLRDVIAAQAGAVSLVNADLLELATKAAERDGTPALLRRMGVLDETKNAISARNGAVRLQLERMLIEMLS